MSNKNSTKQSATQSEMHKIPKMKTTFKRNTIKEAVIALNQY